MGVVAILCAVEGKREREGTGKGEGSRESRAERGKSTFLELRTCEEGQKKNKIMDQVESQIFA